MSNLFSKTRLQCQCVLTHAIPRIDKYLAALEGNPTVKVQIVALQTAVQELKRLAADHREFQLEYARAMAEQDKRAITGDNLQTTAYKMGRKRTEEEQADEDKRQVAIEMGRIKKRPKK